MSDEQKQQIFDNLKKNSIGNNKRSSYKKTIKKAILKVSLASIMITFLSACSVGINKENKQVTNEVVFEENSAKEYSGFSKEVVEAAEMSVAIRILRNGNMLDSFNYTEEGYEANYTKEVYARARDINDSNLHGFYLFTTKDTFNEILKSQGYSDMNNYLISKGYIDNYGNPSIEMWEESNLEEMGKYMNDILNEERNAR